MQLKRFVPSSFFRRTESISSLLSNITKVEAKVKIGEETMRRKAIEIQSLKIAIQESKEEERVDESFYSSPRNEPAGEENYQEDCYFPYQERDGEEEGDKGPILEEEFQREDKDLPTISISIPKDLEEQINEVGLVSLPDRLCY